MREWRFSWPVVCSALALLSVVLVLTDASAVVRAPIVLTFLLVCPGLAIVRFLRIPDFAAKASVAVALSIALVGIVSLVQAYAGVWNPTVGVLAIAALTLAVVAIEVLSGRREAVRA